MKAGMKLVKLLILEDLPTDVELAKREIYRVLPECEIFVTDNEPGFVAAIRDFKPDVVISDYRLPGYDGLTALKYVLKNSRFTPVIILTGSMNEDTAVACMKAGAVDYVIKEHIRKLGPAIQAALKHRLLLIEKDESSKKLAKSETRFRNIFHTHSAVKLIIDPIDGAILDANMAAAKFYGWSIDELRSMKIGEINSLPAADVIRNLNLAINNMKSHFAYKHRKADGTIVDVETFTSRVQFDDKVVLHSIIHDVTEKKRAEQRLRLLSHAVEQSPACIVITNPEGEIEYVNHAFTRQSGYSLEELRGKDTGVFSSGLDGPELTEQLWATIRSGKNWLGQRRHRTKSGDIFWENLMIAPMTDASGNIEHFVGFSEDISEKVNMFEEVVAAKEKAEEMVKARSDFLAAMSHELRTPFIGIMGFAEILKEELELPDHREMAERILDSSERLKRTLTGILRITELENVESLFHPSPVNLAELIEEKVALFERKIEDKNLTLMIEVEPVRNSYLIDRVCYDDIIVHLLSNAITYTLSGVIKIEANEIDTADGKMVTIKFVDTGIGIPQDRLSLIFEEFRQVSEGHSRSYEGTGLGLSIVKKTVEILGGTITVKSTPGEGSDFTVTIPVVTA